MSFFETPILDSVHIRFTLTANSLSNLLIPYMHDRGISYGRPRVPAIGEAERVIVEFSSPNVALDFNGNHFRSTILGAYISNMYEYMGWEVVRLNYLGDWGKHIGLLAVGWEKFGSEHDFDQADDQMAYLREIYTQVEIEFAPEQEASRKLRDQNLNTAEVEKTGIYAQRDAFFKRMEDGDPQALALWERFRRASVREYKADYAKMGITFDKYAGECKVSFIPETVQKVETILKEKGVYEESEGSWIVDFKKHGAKHLGTAIFRGRTGSSTYLLRDIVLALHRDEKYSPSLMIHVTSQDQEVHFKRIVCTLRLMGMDDLAEKVRHVSFKRIKDFDTQLHQPHSLGRILDRAISLLRQNVTMGSLSHVEDVEALLQSAGPASLMTQDFNSKRANSYTLDIKQMSSIKGNTGIELCMLYSKVCKLTGTIQDVSKPDLDSIDFAVFENQELAHLLRVLARYPDVTNLSFLSLEPSIILAYIFRLGKQMSTTIDGYVKVKMEADLESETRAWEILLISAKVVFESGLRLLGFQFSG